MLDAVTVNLDNSRTQINDVDEDGYTALHYAARYNRLAVTEVLVKAGAGLYKSCLGHSSPGATSQTFAPPPANDKISKFLTCKQWVD